MNTVSWQEDYQVLLQEIRDSLEGESATAKIAGELILIRMIYELKPIFKKCQQEATEDAARMAGNYVKKLLAEEHKKLEAAGFCPTCKRPIAEEQ
jgi:hypothetical protein